MRALNTTQANHPPSSVEDRPRHIRLRLLGITVRSVVNGLQRTDSNRVQTDCNRPFHKDFFARYFSDLLQTDSMSYKERSPPLFVYFIDFEWIP